MAGSKRGFETVRDMILSLGVVGIFVAVLIAVAPHSAENPVKPVDYTLSFQQASRVAPYTLLGPQGLDKQWRATSFQYDSTDPAASTWHIGFIDPAGKYAALEMTNGTSTPFVTKQGFDGTVTGTRQIGADTWQVLDGEKYRSLVRVKGGVTTMVTGNATYDDLATLAAALAPAPPLPTY